jgi:thioredoxin-dependent peroxiredoxin
MAIDIGSRLPPFELPDQDGSPVRFEDLLGKGPVVLFFYPKDETLVCTAEACSFRDAYEDFVAAGATVVGISSDDVQSHRRFADKHKLQYRLLADEGGRVRSQLGVPRTLFGLRDGRVTYVLDKDGVVKHRFQAALKAQAHVDEAVKMVKTLTGV